MWLRFQKMRGVLDDAAYTREIFLVRTTLEGMGDSHWQEYLAAWPV